MVVTAFALNWLNDDRGNIGAFPCQHSANLLLRMFFVFDDGLGAPGWWQRKIQDRRCDAGPGKFGEMINLARVGIGQAHGVTAAAMERAFEMDDFRPPLTAARG